jgi:hypothetical protein
MSVDPVTCDVSNLSGSVACEGPIDGNATNDIPGSTFFSHNDWMLIYKVDADSGSDGGLTVTGGGTSGGWELSDYGGYGTVMLALKGGPNFSVYLLDGATSGDWNTFGITTGGGKPGPGLSNFTAWGRGTAPDPGTPIPLPAAGWMLLAGLGGLVAIRRRKNAAV